MTRRGRSLVPSGAAILVLARPADAHLVTTGLGPVYDGIVHLVASPADLALVVALALLAGMRGAPAGRTLLAVLPLCWLAGGTLGLLTRPGAKLDWVFGACLLVAGALVAADRDFSLPVVGAAAGGIGALHGFLTGPALADAPAAGLELAGSAVALVVVATLLAGAVVSLRAFWARTAVRIAGSWIAATGLLMLGWALRGAFRN